MLAVQLPNALEERLTAVARAVGRAPDECVIDAVLGYLSEMEALRQLEDGYRAMAADASRETEAQEWCNALAMDLADEAR